MEQWSVAHKNLQIFCAQFWDTTEHCQRILSDIGVRSVRIRMGEPSIARWYSILTELVMLNDGSMARLVQVLMADYPDNKSLRDVCATWIPSPPPLMVLEKKEAFSKDSREGESKKRTPAGNNNSKAPPETVPVVVPKEFASQASLLLAKVETLWEAMVQQNEKIERMEVIISKLEGSYNGVD